jgi:hypothetical protein
VLALAAASAATGCGGSAPSTPVSPTSVLTPTRPPMAPEISGTVWLHSRTGVRRYAKASFGGWVDSARAAAGTWGSVDEQGRYTLRGVRCLLPFVCKWPLGRSPFSRAPVLGDVLPPGDRASRDVHVVDDPSQLWSQFCRRRCSRILRRCRDWCTKRASTACAFQLDMFASRWTPLGGLGFVGATTMTDAEGRYVLCGLVATLRPMCSLQRTAITCFERACHSTATRRWTFRCAGDV